MEWIKAVERHEVTIKCKIVMLMIGACDVRTKAEGKVANRLRKLVLRIYNHSGAVVTLVYVSAVLPQADVEVEFQEKIREVNGQISKMTKDVKKYQRQWLHTCLCTSCCWKNTSILIWQTA